MDNIARIQIPLSKFNRLCASITGTGFFIILFLTVYEVIARYLFESPTMWTLEITGYVLLIACFLSAAYTLETGGHISIDLVSMNLRPKPKRILAIIVDILGIIFVALWLWKSTVLAIDSYNLHWISRTMMGVTLWPFYVVIPLCLLLMLFQYIVLLAQAITGGVAVKATQAEE